MHHSLRPGRDHAWLDSSLEHLLRWCNCPLVEVRLLHNVER